MGVRRAFALLAVLLTPAPAGAHLGHEIARAERYLKLDVSGHRARVVVSITLGPIEGGRVLAAADADGDGRVSEAERDAHLAQWGAGLRDELPIELDGVRQVVSWDEPYMEPIGRVQAVPVTIELVARLELEGGRQTLRLTDAMVRREVYDRTDVAFRVRDDARLVASGAGPDPDEPELDLAFGPQTNRTPPQMLTAVLETPERASDWPRWLLPVLGVLTLAWLLGALIVRRARR